MAISEPYSNTALVISTTELSLVSGTSTLQTITDDGIYQVFIDLNDMIDADILELKIYETVRASGTKRVVHYETLANAQGTAKSYASPALVLIHGWDVTLKRIGGTDVTIDGSIRKIA